jgi:Leucine-rich repeat (LRR) protein
VLDLEGYKGLNKKKILKSICKILLLKYLSLRNTDVTQLPKQIKDLQCLETLDIRQTKVQILAKKAIVLPLLKHFLAGDKISVSNDTRESEESFSAVDMPLGIDRMKNLEILSHVQVTNSSSDLTGIAELLKLRKLGVALCGTRAKMSDLFLQIDKLHKCLRSLSVRIHQQAVGEKHDALTPPCFIRSLNVSGLTSGLPHMIQEFHQLVKLTLTETYLKEDDLRILGKLRGPRFLKLLNKAYTESELSFKEEEFQTLNFLLVRTTDVTNINFATGAAPKLERIIWSFPTTACVSGLRHLPELREFVLNGDCNPDQVIDEIVSHTKFPFFKPNPHVQQRDDRAVASSSSAS